MVMDEKKSVIIVNPFISENMEKIPEKRKMVIGNRFRDISA